MKKIKVSRPNTKLKKILYIFNGVLFILFLMVLFLDPHTYGDFFIGTIVSEYKAESEHNPEKRIIVELDDGRKVHVKQMVVTLNPVIKGKRLIVQERTTMILKRKSYYLVKIIDTNSNLSEEQLLEQIKNRYKESHIN